jgi:hypothetical protein
MQDRVSSLRGQMGLVRGAGLAAGLAMLLAPAALAGVPVVTGGGTLTFTEDTVLNVTTIRFVGSINTAGMEVVSTGNVLFGSRMRPFVGDLQLGPGIAPGITYLLNANVWPSFATELTSQTFGTFLGPDRVGFINNGNSDQIRVSDTYVSGSPLDAAAQFSGTFATLGIVPGNYTATVPGNGPITYVFSTIPTPGAAALLGVGGLVAMRRRR